MYVFIHAWWILYTTYMVDSSLSIVYKYMLHWCSTVWYGYRVTATRGFRTTRNKIDKRCVVLFFSFTDPDPVSKNNADPCGSGSGYTTPARTLPDIGIFLKERHEYNQYILLVFRDYNQELLSLWLYLGECCCKRKCFQEHCDPQNLKLY
jgi:hypothetical protein